MRVGILGGGQLAQMLILAGYPLGFRFNVIDKTPHDCTRELSPFIQVDFEISSPFLEQLKDIDVITVETENIPVEFYSELAKVIPCYPPPRALEVSQDRLIEKQFVGTLGIETAPYRTLSEFQSVEDLFAFSPSIAKTRRFGYDGKGQKWIKSIEDAQSLIQVVGYSDDWIVEQVVCFDRELSVIGVFGEREFFAYPLSENTHRQGILRTSRAPAPDATPALQNRAEEIVSLIGNALDYRGVLVVELFQRGGELLVNELAPRVHNSGHHTIESAETSQFENHLRAIAGLPIGSCALAFNAVMENLISEVPPLCQLASEQSSSVHLYGKAAQAGRKLGHVTRLISQ